VKKKEREWLKRVIAGGESQARRESEARQERIKVLWHAITSGDLARDAKDLAENELVRSLVELVHLQKLEIEYLTRFRRDWERILAYYPEHLRKLSFESKMAERQPLIEKQLAEERSTKRYERKRHRYQWPATSCDSLGMQAQFPHS
jgi:hypothetical protein